MKTFNTTAVCIPEENYMVDLSGRVREIARLVAAKKIFYDKQSQAIWENDHAYSTGKISS